MAKIAVIGTGRMGVGLATGWLRAGHQVTLGSRSAAAKRDVAAGAAVAAPAAALLDAEIVVLAMPFSVTAPFAREHAAQLRGKIVIDITNPFQNLPDNRVAGAELTAQAIGEDAHIVAAFKGNFAATLSEPLDAVGVRRDVLYAGDTEWAKLQVAKLIEDLGFRPVDCGSLHNARILDGMVTLMLELDARYAGRSGNTSWKFVSGPLV